MNDSDKLCNVKMKVSNEKLFHVFNSRFNYNMLALSTNGCLNIGSMIRSSNLTGVKRFFIFGKRNYDKRSALGLYKYMKIIRVSKDFPDGIDENENLELVQMKTKTKLETEDYEFDTELFIKIMNQHNMVPVFVEQCKDSVKLNQINWNAQLYNIPPGKEICFIMGNEHHGVPDNILNTKKLFEGSFSLEIPQTGVINSYNVSNCASIILNSIYNHSIKKIADIYL